LAASRSEIRRWFGDGVGNRQRIPILRDGVLTR
jgi:hypothetical protein